MEIKFWKDKEKKLIETDLFSATAETLAKRVFQESSHKLNKPTQIRKFYDEVLRLNSIIKVNPEEFDTYLPYIKMINAKAAYAMGRDLISRSFKDYISSSISQINDIDDFEVFTGLFEAFMGFYKYYAEKGERPTNRGGRR